MHALESAFRSHEKTLWGVAYRITGSAQDADECLQSAMVRCLERPPDLSRPLRPWLVRVTANLARDALRARRTRAQGVWLPWPQPVDPEASLAMRQTATLAWLVAAEALTPTQRTLLVLNQVLELSGPEIAALMDLKPGTVRVTLHRARKALADQPLPSPTPQVFAQHQAVMLQLAGALASGDADQVVALLSDDAVFLSDGGPYAAAGVPIVGAARVARVVLALNANPKPDDTIAPTATNGLPAVWGERPSATGWLAPRYLVQLVLDDAGRIARILTQLNPPKLDRFRGGQVSPCG